MERLTLNAQLLTIKFQAGAYTQEGLAACVPGDEAEEQEAGRKQEREALLRC